MDNELSKLLPPDFRPGKGEVEAAYRIFGEKKSGYRPDLRILTGSYDRSQGLDKPGVPDRTIPTLRIIIDNRLCLFFYGSSGEWIFDGYECGDYEKIWKEFDWLPTKEE